jgi:hypothetical protein
VKGCFRYSSAKGKKKVCFAPLRSVGYYENLQFISFESFASFLQQEKKDYPALKILIR